MKISLCKLLSILLCLSLGLSLCACGRGEENMSADPVQDSGTEEAGADGETLTLSHMARPLAKPAGLKRLHGMSISGGEVFLLGSRGRGESIFRTEGDSGSWQEIKISFAAEPGEAPEDTGGEPPLDISDFSFDGEHFFISGSRWEQNGPEYYIYVFDSEGAFLQLMSLELPEDMYIESSKILGNYTVLISENKSLVFVQGRTEPLYEYEGRFAFAALAGDRLYAAIPGGSETELCRIDIETGEPERLCGFPSQEFMTYSSYRSESGLYIADEETLMAVDDKTGEMSEALRWNDAGAPVTMAPEYLHIMENGELFFLDTWGNTVYKVEPYEGKPRKILTIAYAGSGGVYENTARAKFNAENGEYIIRGVSADWKAPEKLLTEITAGDAPDILYMGSSTDREMDNPFIRINVGSNLCTDLMPYLENDPDIGPEDFVPGVLENLAPDGRLYSMPADFHIMSIVAPKELADSFEKWDMDALLRVYEQLPEGYTLFDMDREELMRCFCQYCSVRFTDRLKGSCSFDDPDFARWLELFKNMEYYDYRDSEGYVLEFASVHPGTPDRFREMAGDYEYVGVPSSDGGISFLRGSMGSYAILASSENKEAAWEYIKTMLSYEIQQALSGFGMQVIEKNLRETLNSAGEYTVFTPEDDEKFYSLIASAQGFAYGGKLNDIILQESLKYFNDQKSLEETVDMIQSRAGILVAEQRQ